MKTRQRILNHLRKTRAASAREIARALNLTAPNVRHHLMVLASDGRVEMVTTAKQDLRGRPEKFYSLSGAVLGNNLPALTGALLLEAGSNINWEAIASRLAGTEGVSQLPAAARLRTLIENLNEMHYQSRWEAGAEGPRVLFERCPYAAIIDGHPGLCRMDALLLSGFLEMEARQLGKIEGRQGMCVFAVR
jgi:predicted ArsR family transcriptional regulator